MSKRKLDELYIQQLASQILSEVNIGSDEQFMDQLGEALKIARIPKPKLSTCLNLCKLESKIWSDIYSFIGIEHVFINEIYALNKDFIENLFNNLSFWNTIVRQINPQAQFLNGEENSFLIDLVQVRRYCIHKFHSFKKHQMLNLDIEMVELTGRGITQLPTEHVQESISSPCHIVKVFEPTKCVHLCGLSFYNIDMHWRVYYYIQEAPYCISFDIRAKSVEKGGSKPAHIDLVIASRVLFQSLRDQQELVNQEYIPIVSESSIVLVGIEQLLQTLPSCLSEKFQNYEQSKLTFSISNWEPMFAHPNFIWYFSMLQNIPFAKLDFLLNLLVDNDNNQDIMLDPQNTDPNTLKLVLDYFESLRNKQ